MVGGGGGGREEEGVLERGGRREGEIRLKGSERQRVREEVRQIKGRESLKDVDRWKEREGYREKGRKTGES